LLKRGTVLVDPTDPGEEVRALFYLEHAIQDARLDRSGRRRIVSRRLQFVEIDRHGQAYAAGYAPYLDYGPIGAEELEHLRPVLEADWLRQEIESTALAFAVEHLVPDHLTEVRTQREHSIQKITAAVKDRLTKEIVYWDHRAEVLKTQEQAGRQPRMNWLRARERADNLQARLQRRLEELELERQVSPLPPLAVGGALVVPEGLVKRFVGDVETPPVTFARETQRIEALAMAVVMQIERQLGHEPRDVSKAKYGWDIESRDATTGRLRFIEVKGRVQDASTVTITKNEILAGLNKPDAFILALVEVDGDTTACRYVRCPFHREPDFGVTSVNYHLDTLLRRAETPA
jgi:hypothetical protein